MAMAKTAPKNSADSSPIIRRPPSGKAVHSMSIETCSSSRMTRADIQKTIHIDTIVTNSSDHWIGLPTT